MISGGYRTYKSNGISNMYRHIDIILPGYRHIDGISTGYRHIDGISTGYRHIDGISTGYRHIDRLSRLVYRLIDYYGVYRILSNLEECQTGGTDPGFEPPTL